MVKREAHHELTFSTLKIEKNKTDNLRTYFFQKPINFFNQKEFLKEGKVRSKREG